MNKKARAKDAINKIRHCIMNDKCELIDCGYYGALSSLEELLRCIDDMEIMVHCKDCKYLEPMELLATQRCRILKRCVTDDWFCADGEEKE